MDHSHLQLWRDGATIEIEREKFAGGGGGTLHRVVRQDVWNEQVVVKILKDEILRDKSGLRKERMERMVMGPPDDPAMRGADPRRSIAWPFDVVLENGVFKGYVMPLIQFMKNSKGEIPSIQSVYEPANRIREAPQMTWATQVAMAYNLAEMFDCLHQKQIVVGDGNPQNFLTNFKYVALIDVDEYQIRGANGLPMVSPSRVFFPEHAPPEAARVLDMGAPFEMAHDRFLLGILIHKFLFQGRHPYNGSWCGPGANPDLPTWKLIAQNEYYHRPGGRYRPPRRYPGMSMLPDELVKLFGRCFDEGNTDPSRRPTASEWKAGLYGLIYGGELLECRVHREHRFHAAAGTCPWCELQRSCRLVYYPKVRVHGSPRASVSGKAPSGSPAVRQGGAVRNGGRRPPVTSTGAGVNAGPGAGLAAGVPAGQAVTRGTATSPAARFFADAGSRSRRLIEKVPWPLRVGILVLALAVGVVGVAAVVPPGSTLSRPPTGAENGPAPGPLDDEWRANLGNVGSSDQSGRRRGAGVSPALRIRAWLHAKSVLEYSERAGVLISAAAEPSNLDQQLAKEVCRVVADDIEMMQDAEERLRPLIDSLHELLERFGYIGPAG